MSTRLLEQWVQKPEHYVRSVLERADIQIGGGRPQDIQVHKRDFYARILKEGLLGVGESYMDDWWDANSLDTFVAQVLRENVHEHVKFNRHTVFALLAATFTNRQNRERSTQVAKQHYDLKGILPGILDPYNQYTCAYFDGTTDLNTAQENKLDLICRKLQLQEDDAVLDIGCGWGGFAKYAAEHYGCHVTGISISEEQIAYAQNFCAGLPVDIQYCDYRDHQGTYDKILTCGMIEHVGYKNYRGLFETVHSNLKDDGLFLLHTIGGNQSVKTNDPFLDKYIFPNGMVPSVSQLDKAREGLLTLQDFHNLGTHYDPTLVAWHKNMQEQWSTLSQHYDERFRRMFEYYLLSCAGSFRAGGIHLWQMVFSKQGNVRDYRGPR